MSSSPALAPSSHSASSTSGSHESSEDDCPGYDRDLVIRELTFLYQFLTRIHIPPSDLLLPPEGGWPELTSQFLQPLGKTEEVNELLRRLPYLRREDYHDITMIWAKTVGVDYRGNYVIERLRQGNDPDIGPDYYYSAVPAHVVSLMVSSDARYGYWMLLDTERGTVSLCDFMESPQQFPGYKDYCLGAEEPDLEESSDSWKDYHAMSITDFCEFIKHEWTSMTIIAVSREDFMLKEDFDEETLAMFRKIFETHNWLRKGYRQQECLKAAQKLAEEKGQIVLGGQNDEEE